MKRIIFVLIFVMILSGCTFNTEQNITIEGDNSGEITQTILFEEDIYDTFAAEIESSIDEEEEEDENFNTEIIEEDGKKGVRISTSFDNLDELKKLLEDNDDELPEGEEGDIVFSYTVNNDDSVTVAIEYKQLTEDDDTSGTKIIYDVYITVPKIIESNAEDVDGKTMHWDFTTESVYTVSFTYTKQPAYTMILKVVGITLLASGIGFGGFLTYNKFIKKEKQTPEEMNAVE